MCVSEIVFYPHLGLRAHAQEVADVSHQDVRDVIKQLTDTMAAYEHCVGLAANQIGSPLNIFVADASKNKQAKSEHGFVVVINPEIVEKNGVETKREGCMSVPDFTGNVARARDITLRAIDVTGAEIALNANDFEARVFQHEIDHLRGRVFLDLVTSARDVFARKKYT